MNNITVLKDFILSQNKYFSYGFDNAQSLLGKKPMVVSYEPNGEYTTLLPNDMLGNYFYLKKRDTTSLLASAKIADCLNYQDYHLNTNVDLIAFVEKGCVTTLTNNLIFSLLKSDVKSTIRNINYDKYSIISTEMGVSKTLSNELLKTLSYISDVSVIKINFDLIEDLKLNCITNPCKC